jgi:hypothetical protein
VSAEVVVVAAGVVFIGCVVVIAYAVGHTIGRANAFHDAIKGRVKNVGEGRL